MINEEVEALIHAKIYKNRKELFIDAFRALIETKPALKIETAVELYKTGRVSFSRACEIAGVNIEEFKEILASRAIKRIVRSPSKDKIKEEVTTILGERM